MSKNSVDIPLGYVDIEESVKTHFIPFHALRGRLSKIPFIVRTTPWNEGAPRIPRF